MKGQEVVNINHCIICFYHNEWYKEDDNPQYFHKLIQTGELEWRERLYNDKTQRVEYSDSFKEFSYFIFQSGESTYLTEKHIISNEQSDEEGNGEYNYITNAVPYYFEKYKNSNGAKDMKTVDFVKRILKEDNITFENPLETHCFTISFPEYMYYNNKI